MLVKIVVILAIIDGALTLLIFRITGKIIL